MSEYFRVLGIRRHKASWFLDVTSSSGERQLIIDPELAVNAGISMMSLFEGTLAEAVNSRGQLVSRVVHVHSCKNPSIGPTQRGRHAHLISSTARRHRIFRGLFAEAVSQHFLTQGYLRLLSRASMEERGTSTVSPLRISGQYVDRFLKITHELELKSEVACTLRPTFEIGYVIRDVRERISSPAEYLLLEFVNPTTDISIIRNEVLGVIDIACRVAARVGLPHAHFDDMIVLDVDREVPGLSREQRLTWFRRRKASASNTLFLNSPVSSPLAKWIDGCRKETIWIVGGESVAHGYRDETDCYLFHDECLRQQEDLKASGIDADLPRRFLRLLEMGVPESVSLGFGLDRFLEHFLLPDGNTTSRSGSSRTPGREGCERPQQ